MKLLVLKRDLGLSLAPPVPTAPLRSAGAGSPLRAEFLGGQTRRLVFRNWRIRQLLRCHRRCFNCHCAFADINPLLVILHRFNRLRQLWRRQRRYFGPDLGQLRGNLHFAQAQLFQLLQSVFQKLAVFWSALVQRPVAQRLLHRRPFLAESTKIDVEVGARKLIPDVVLGHFRRMQHVGSIKTVVTQVIYQQFVCRKVGHARQQVAHDVGGHAQHRLAHRIQRQRVLKVPHRAHREHKPQVGVDAA